MRLLCLKLLLFVHAAVKRCLCILYERPPLVVRSRRVSGHRCSELTLKLRWEAGWRGVWVSLRGVWAQTQPDLGLFSTTFHPPPMSADSILPHHSPLSEDEELPPSRPRLALQPKDTPLPTRPHLLFLYLSFKNHLLGDPS